MAASAPQLLARGLANMAARPLAELRDHWPTASDLDSLVRLLEEHRDRVEDWLAEPDAAGSLGLALGRWLQSKNQFLDLGPATQSRLHALARTLLRSLPVLLERDRARFADGVETAAREAHRGLLQIVDELDRASPAPGFAYRDLVCEEYSPELQLRVLGLDPNGLAEPILDLGCGEHALLVEHLSKLGKRAVGIDRVARPRRGVVRGDWLETPLPAGSFGTVISHLGFSHHFAFQHLANGAVLERYAHRYMEILAALMPGGAFAYAPGLPFVEEHLPPERWRLERRDVPELDRRVSWLELYAARVTRIG